MNRRGFLIGASLLVAPSIVRVSSLMPVSLGFIPGTELCVVCAPALDAQLIRDHVGQIFTPPRGVPTRITSLRAWTPGPQSQEIVATLAKPYWHYPRPSG